MKLLFNNESIFEYYFSVILYINMFEYINKVKEDNIYKYISLGLVSVLIIYIIIKTLKCDSCKCQV